MITLGSIASRNARHFSDKPAFVMGSRRVTFAEHHERVGRLVRALRARGLRPGDRIAMLSRNSLECLDVFGAAEQGGFALAPLNFRLTAAELEKVLSQIQPRVLFLQSRYADVTAGFGDGLVVFMDDAADAGDAVCLSSVIREGPTEPLDYEPGPDEVCYLMCTSGTTGTPRVAMLTQGGQFLDAQAVALEMDLSPEDRHLATMPLFHVGGRAIVLGHTLRGCTVHIQDGFDAPAVAEELVREQITTTQVVPTMLSWLLDEPLAESPFPALRMVFYASAPMPVGLLRRGIERLGRIFMQGYGQTESGPLATTLRPEEHSLFGAGAERLESCGRAVAGVDLRVLDPDGHACEPGAIGELAIRSPFNMVGYLGQPELTATTLVDGWLRTGDMARIDGAGYVFIVDRKKDMIISGGENIYPREVEEVLHLHPAVAEAAVIGLPDELWGEAPVALVVTRDRSDDELARELQLFCRDRLAAYKCPKAVEICDSLPKTPTGKVVKRELRLRFRRGREPAGVRPGRAE
jgi:long-chain acyl-CoA synthetase